MVERKERLELNQIDSLSKKISANKAKVNQNRGVPGLESEVERLDIAIESVNIKIMTFFLFVIVVLRGIQKKKLQEKREGDKEEILGEKKEKEYSIEYIFTS